MPRDAEGRDWGDVSTSRGTPGIVSRRQRLGGRLSLGDPADTSISDLRRPGPWSVEATQSGVLRLDTPSKRPASHSPGGPLWRGAGGRWVAVSGKSPSRPSERPPGSPSRGASSRLASASRAPTWNTFVRLAPLALQPRACRPAAAELRLAHRCVLFGQYIFIDTDF